MWACTGTIIYWKGSKAVINSECPPFFVAVQVSNEIYQRTAFLAIISSDTLMHLTVFRIPSFHNEANVIRDPHKKNAMFNIAFWAWFIRPP